MLLHMNTLQQNINVNFYKSWEAKKDLCEAHFIAIFALSWWSGITPAISQYGFSRIKVLKDNSTVNIHFNIKCKHMQHYYVESI